MLGLYLKSDESQVRAGRPRISERPKKKQKQKTNSHGIGEIISCCFWITKSILNKEQFGIYITEMIRVRYGAYDISPNWIEKKTREVGRIFLV